MYSLGLITFFLGTPWEVRILCKKSTMMSFSWTPRPLKCLRTVLVNWSLLCLRYSLRRAIVGEYRPTLPGWVRTHWWTGFAYAVGVWRR